MKTQFVDQLKVEEPEVISYFLVTQCDQKATKGGKPYLSLKLGDKTGSLDSKLWDIPEGFTTAAGDFVKVAVTLSTYKDALQLKVNKIRVLDRSEITPDDYIPASKRDRDELMSELTALIVAIESPGLRDAVDKLVAKYWNKLRDCPAAKKNHQPYLGGLLEHILGIGNCALRVCQVYPQLNRDLLIAAAIVHDIGKVSELIWDTHIGYSRIGSLVGHVALGIGMFSEIFMDCPALDRVTFDHILHIIASHHGQLEWRAAAVPQTKEAMVFHCLDMLDARLHTCELVIEAGVDANGFTPFNNAMQTALWNGL